MQIILPVNELENAARSHLNLNLQIEILDEYDIEVSFKHPRAQFVKLIVKMKVISIQDNVLTLKYSTTRLIEDVLMNATSLFGNSLYYDVLMFDVGRNEIRICLENICQFESVLDYVTLENVRFEERNVIFTAS